MFRSIEREIGAYLLLVTLQDLVDDFVDDLDWGSLVVLAGSLLNELDDLVLIHFPFFFFLSDLLCRSK